MSELHIVAEVSCNHLGSKERAHRIVECASEAGADMVKFQVWQSGTMCICPNYVVPSGPWAGERLQRLYAEAYTPLEWLPSLFQHARDLGIEPFGSAFDKESVDCLDSLGVKRHKCSSFELTDIPLIQHMASKGRPIILSTGMASHQDIFDAGVACYPCDVTVLKCSSAYPAAPDGILRDANSRWTFNFKGCEFGLSDHTEGIGVSVAAVALGATMIEKHLTLSRADGGPDAGFSMEPHEFKQLVTECRRAHAAIQPAEPQKEHTELRRSLWWAEDIQEGETITASHLVTARPALGLHPREMDRLIGTKATYSAKARTPVKCVN